MTSHGGGAAVEPEAADGMEDEYGAMDDAGETWICPELMLECGVKLKQLPVRYQQHGTLAPNRDNVVIVCHALTGNAAVTDWWKGMVGPGKAVDTTRYLVICANVLGSCYGTCGPTSINPDTGAAYRGDFPVVTIRDTVRLHSLLVEHALKITDVFCVVGGSMGGMQVLEWSFVENITVRAGVVMSTGGRHQPWQIGLSELQRQAILADPKFNNGYYPDDSPPTSGIAVARQIAMVSYRTHRAYFTKFGRKLGKARDGRNRYEVESYLNYQGQKFIERGFDANSYIRLTKMMDSHDVSRGRGDYIQVMNSIRIPTMIIGITSDVLYPVNEQEELADYLGNSELHLVDSDEGHDGFLLEQDRIGPLIEQFFLKIHTIARQGQQEAEIKGLRRQLDTLAAEVDALKARL